MEHSEPVFVQSSGESLSASPAGTQPALRGNSVALKSRAALLGGPESEPGWLLEEDGFTLAREHEVESLFAIGNGYVGNRGSLAEGSSLSAPATFAAGVFEFRAKPGSVPGLFVLPDWTGVRAWIDGQMLSMEHGQRLEHRRILDMLRGVLWREWRQRDPNGRITRLVAFRLASLADRHLLVQSVIFTPENYSGEVRLETSIELPPEVQASPPRDEYRARRSAMRPNVLPLALRSPGRDVTVAFGAASQLHAADGQDAGLREIDIGERRIVERFTVQVEIGAEYRLDRLVSIYTSHDSVQDAADAAATHVNQMLPGGIPRAIRDHTEAWYQRWHDSDIVVEGDEALQRALRFAIYHLTAAANPEDDHVSIGARALTGEAYKGHVFWDTESYMVPFFTFTYPRAARALLGYRYHMLPAARQKAQEAGYKGAMYPWESADTGEETTPKHVIDPGGHVISVLNGELENHITADVAYAIWQYWNASGDDQFLLDSGAEIIMETARFWASRGSIESDGLFHIRHVIGPDEYHEDVDDSAFTNLLAAWNLARAVDVTRLLHNRWPERWSELSRRLQITPEETAAWSRLSALIFRGFHPDTLLFEQHQGYFNLEPIDLTAYESRNTAMDVILGHTRIQKTNVVKQADVVMAMYLLWDDFPGEVREANFRYYEPRTGHGSSLSPSIHALVAARLGDLERADKYLRQAAEIDLGNNMGNAAGGIHAAAVGGLWQAMVLGFGGLSLRPDGLFFDPHLLPRWRRLSFPVQWRNRKLRVVIDPARFWVKVEDGPDAMKITLARGSELVIHPRQQYVAERQGEQWGSWQEVP